MSLDLLATPLIFVYIGFASSLFKHVANRLTALMSTLQKILIGLTGTFFILLIVLSFFLR